MMMFYALKRKSGKSWRFNNPFHWLIMNLWSGELKVLIDRKEGSHYVGRTEYDSPEVDNEVWIEQWAKNKTR
jgi:hypothetical protein